VIGRSPPGGGAVEDLPPEVDNELRDAVVKLKRVTSDLRSSSKRWR
jgi:hypothetical protein